MWNNSDPQLINKVLYSLFLKLSNTEECHGFQYCTMYLLSATLDMQLLVCRTGTENVQWMRLQPWRLVNFKGLMSTKVKLLFQWYQLNKTSQLWTITAIGKCFFQHFMFGFKGTISFWELHQNCFRLWTLYVVALSKLRLFRQDRNV